MNFADRRSLILILIALGVTVIFTKLSVGFLPSYDDGYYAQKAREMLASGHWLTPTIAGNPRFDNPPGFMMLVASSFKLFGVDEFAARFPSALGGLLGVLGTFLLFELLLGTRVGFLAGVTLSLTTIYLKYSRHAMMDVTVAAAGVWSAYFFVRALGGNAWLFLLAGLLGSYVPFAKSLFGVIPPTIYFAYLVSTRRWSAFRAWQLWTALVLYALPYGAWCAIEYARYDQGFLMAHFHNLMFNMATKGGQDDHVYDYVLVLLKYFPHFLPFMAFGIWVSARARGEAARGLWFGLIYFLAYFVILSAGSTTKTWYFISALPACAGLAAVGLDRALRRFSLEQVGRFVAGLTFVIFLVVQMTPVTLSNERAVDTKRIAPYVRAAAAQGFDLRSYQFDNYGLNSSLLFYSDHNAPVVDDAGLKRLLGEGAGKLAVIFDTGEWRRLQATFPRLKPVRVSTKLTLTSTEALAQEEIF